MLSVINANDVTTFPPVQMGLEQGGEKSPTVWDHSIPSGTLGKSAQGKHMVWEWGCWEGRARVCYIISVNGKPLPVPGPATLLSIAIFKA